MLLATYFSVLVSLSLESFTSTLTLPWAGYSVEVLYQFDTICSWKVSVHLCLSLYSLQGAKTSIKVLKQSQILLVLLSPSVKVNPFVPIKTPTPSHPSPGVWRYSQVASLTPWVVQGEFHQVLTTWEPLPAVCKQKSISKNFLYAFFIYC